MISLMIFLDMTQLISFVIQASKNYVGLARIASHN